MTIEEREVRETITRTLRKEEERGYIEIPFILPAGIEEIRVVYSYERTGEETAVVDLGIRDMHRVRGWSGGARESFFISQANATPGYLSGPLEEGEWAILLGAHRIPKQGISVRLEITLVKERYRWLKGDLHSHTHHSDGVHTVEEAIRMAKEAGLDFLALTDHNTVSQNQALPQDERLLVIPGMELTTEFGHTNLLGVIDPLPDFRVRSDEELARKIFLAKEMGAKVVLNHPYDGDCGWRWDWNYAYDWVEVWNGPWRKGNQDAISWWQDELRKGRKLVAVGGSDYHRPHPFLRYGMPTNWVYARNRSIAAIFAAIDAGHVSLSVLPEGPLITLLLCNAMMGDTVRRCKEQPPVEILLSSVKEKDRIRLISDSGIIWEMSVDEITYQLPHEEHDDEERNWLTIPWNVTHERFLRVEIWRHFTGVGKTLLAALSNPIYFEE